MSWATQTVTVGQACPKQLHIKRVLLLAVRHVCWHLCLCRYVSLPPVQVHRGQLVFDPYAGTGSILVAAAARGAHVLGGDIDPRVISKGKVGDAVSPCQQG